MFETITGHKALPTILGLVGAAIALTYSASPPGKRQWFAAVLSGGAFAFVGTPVLVAAVRHYLGWDWLPQDGSVEGLVGLVFGIAGMRVVSGIITASSTFASDPVGFIITTWDRIRGRKDVAS